MRGCINKFHGEYIFIGTGLFILAGFFTTTAVLTAMGFPRGADILPATGNSPDESYALFDGIFPLERISCWEHIISRQRFLITTMILVPSNVFLSSDMILQMRRFIRTVSDLGE